VMELLLLAWSEVGGCSGGLRRSWMNGWWSPSVVGRRRKLVEDRVKRL
jgi:hypothetical protein